MDTNLDLESLCRLKFMGVPLWPFAAIGAYFVATAILSFLWRLYRQINVRTHHFDKFQELGQWAVVTGASDGIGQAYAEQLAAKGLNIVLVSRTESKLQAVAKGITTAHPKVQVRYIVADFSKSDIYDRIENELKDLDIGVLVNNVGQACDDIQFYWETSHEFVQSMLNVNLISVCLMTHIVMPRMAAKNRGLIINVASLAGQLPPYIFVMYGCTKNFLKRFSWGLQMECRKGCPGVIVQDLSPLFVATKLAHLKGNSNFIALDPNVYVAGSLKTVGIPNTHGHISHEVQGFFLNLMPRWAMCLGMTGVMNGLRKLSVYNKKKAEEASKKN